MSKPRNLQKQIVGTYIEIIIKLNIIEILNFYLVKNTFYTTSNLLLLKYQYYRYLLNHKNIKKLVILTIH